MNTDQSQIIFYKVKDNTSKIKYICRLCEEAFHFKNRLLITAPHLQAANFLDQLIWKAPIESFIPHVVTDMPSIEWIAISLQNQENVNQAKQLLNLCQDVPKIYEEIEIIYELFDETLPEKLIDSKKKLEIYQSKGANIKIID